MKMFFGFVSKWSEIKKKRLEDIGKGNWIEKMENSTEFETKMKLSQTERSNVHLKWSRMLGTVPKLRCRLLGYWSAGEKHCIYKKTVKTNPSAADVC